MKIIKLTSSFIRKSIKTSFTAIACLSVFFLSISCASLPKNEAVRNNRMKTESGAERQAEKSGGVSKSAENESATSLQEKNDGVLGSAENGNAVSPNGSADGALLPNENARTGAGDGSSLADGSDKAKSVGDSDEARAVPDTERMSLPIETSEKSNDAPSNAENLSERIRGDLPEKSEEAMRGSSSIDEPVVREGVSANGSANVPARHEAPVRQGRGDAVRDGETSPTANAAGGERRRGISAAQTDVNTAGANSRQAGADEAQRESGRQTNRATSIDTTRSVQDARGRQTDKTSPANARGTEKTQTVSADTSASGTEARRENADSLVGADKIDTPALPSRSVHIAKNQYLDVVYPGGGWIYLGETDGTKLLSFFGKKLAGVDTAFTLRAKNAGKSMLHFYKNDILTGDAIDDYLEVIVEDKIGSAAERIISPSYADIVPPRPSSADGKAPEENEEIAPSGSAEDGRQRFSETTEDGAPISGRTADFRNGADGENASADESAFASSENTRRQTEAASANAVGADDYALDESGLLEKAKSAYNEKNYAKTLALLDLFFARAVSRIDEGLYLKGQTLEAKSALQNIKGAIDAYDELLQNWPESGQWQNARRRSIYLKRMYVDIR